MNRKTLFAAASVAALLLSAGAAHAASLGASDPVGDFLPTFGGVATPDLDVVSTFGTYDASTSMIHISGTFAGAVNPANTGALYVFGFDRGAGTSGFAANGLPGVVFDAIVSLNPSNLSASSIRLLNTGTNTPLPVSSITIAGNTISADFSALMLPSTGLAANKYTFNLWPRYTIGTTGFAAISDFAPDGANLTLAPVPEPETYAMLVAGLGVIGYLRRRRNAG